MIRASLIAALAANLFVISAPAHAQLYGIQWETGNLYTISTSDASMDYVGNTGIAHLGSLEYRRSDGFLYAIGTGEPPALYRIDPDDATTTQVGLLGTGIFETEGGLAIAPDGTAYGAYLTENSGAGPANALYTIDLDTGLATVLDTFGFEDEEEYTDLNGLGVRSDGKLVGIRGVTDGELVELDPATGTVNLIALIDTGFGDFNSLGFIGGISLVDDIGYFATGNDGAPLPSALDGSNALYSFDPFTGAHSFIGSFSPTIPSTSDGISGIAFVHVPEPATLALFVLGLVGLGFERRRRCAT